MRKILTLLGTRPELIKMSLVIAKLDAHSRHILVHTGQNNDYELNQVFFDDLGIRKPDHFLAAASGHLAETIANVIRESDRVFEREAPDALLIYGDTNSGLAVIPAKRRKIPVFHLEAGNRSFDQRVPEELNRKVIDHLADVNITVTEHARRYLLAEGLPGELIFKVGSPVAEVLAHFRPKIEASGVLGELGVEQDKYFLVSAHREETVDAPERLATLVESLDALAREYGLPVIVSTHPRTRDRLSAMSIEQLSPLVRFEKPFGFTDYIRLQLGAFCVVSDSGSITEEASLLNLRAVTIREAHERPEGFDAGTLVMCGLEADRLLPAIRLVREGSGSRFAGHVPDYEGGDVSTKIVRIVHSYIDYVNRVVWRKPSPSRAAT